MNWRKWLTVGRIIPTATILLAFATQVLSLFGLVKLSLGEQIILLVMALLAIDALTERITILDKIRSDIRAIGERRGKAGDFLQKRSSLPPLEERLKNARSLDVAGTALLGLTTSYHELLAQKVRKGCKIRLLLLNPENQELMKMTPTLVGSFPLKDHIQEIATSFSAIKSALLPLKPKLECRLSNVPIPHGLFIVNGNDPDGQMRIELYLHLQRPTTTPGITIKNNEDPEWYKMFWEEFNNLWKDAKPY